MTFEEKLKSHAELVNRHLHLLLADFPQDLPSSFRIRDAMRHGLLDGGKRFRPFLLLEAAALFGVGAENALHAAAAVECVHCYSLIHDDLPAMDDDATRRGRPTVHVAFGEAAAILAGDALQALGFEILGTPETHVDGEIRSLLVCKLARAAGWLGMAGGQDMDLQAHEVRYSSSQTHMLQRMKTGALIRWSLEAGAILGSASETQQQALLAYGDALGLGFQIRDDLLDLEGSATQLGKEVGKDAGAGKATLVDHLGIDGAKQRLEALEAEALASLAPFGDKAQMLVEAARFVTRRKR